LNQEIHALVRSISNRLGRQWKEDRDDVAQELYLWIFDKLDYTFFDDDLEDDEYEEKLKRFRSSISWAGERYCRRAKAEREGYNPSDEYFYSLPLLQELVCNYLATGVEAHPPRGRAESVRRSVDASEGGSYLVSMIDVDKGLKIMPDNYRQRLMVRFGPLGDLSDESVAGLSQSEIVTRTGLHPETMRRLLGETKDQIRHRSDTALRSLQRVLGGSSPYKGERYPTAA
jgi:hypothetical protein